MSVLLGGAGPSEIRNIVVCEVDQFRYTLARLSRSLRRTLASDFRSDRLFHSVCRARVFVRRLYGR